jgi:hypothetical protein
VRPRKLGARPGGVLVAGALAALASACAGRARRPATAAETEAVLSRWNAYRESVLARPAAELWYDVRVRRSVYRVSGVAAVHAAPGRTFEVVVEGPAGVALARASWDGSRTTVMREGRLRTFDGDEALSEVGVPLSARALSLLLFGLPDASPPQAVEIGAPHAWLSWRGGALTCELDSSGRATRVLARDGERTVEVRFDAWESGIPSRVRVAASPGGTADLTLRRGEGEAP